MENFLTAIVVIDVVIGVVISEFVFGAGTIGGVGIAVLLMVIEYLFFVKIPDAIKKKKEQAKQEQKIREMREMERERRIREEDEKVISFYCECEKRNVVCDSQNSECIKDMMLIASTMPYLGIKTKEQAIEKYKLGKTKMLEKAKYEEVLSSEVSVSKKKLPNSLKIILVILLMIPLVFFVMDYISPQSQMIRNIRKSSSMSYITVCRSINQVFNTEKSQKKLIKLLESRNADSCGELLRAFEDNGLRSIIIKDYVKERFFHIESIEDLHNIQENTIKCFGNCNYYLPEIQVSKNIFNEYLSQYEEPITYENGKGGYYDEHKEENENRNIHTGGDIYDTKWEYHGDFALKHYKIEYVDTLDFYTIKHKSGEGWFFRGYSMDIDDVFIEGIGELRYADSNFMLINEDNVNIAVEHGGIIKLILIDQ